MRVIFDDMVASLALKHREAILARNRHIIRENLAILDQWIASEPKASYIRPAEVPTSFVKLDVNVPIEAFCLTLLQNMVFYWFQEIVLTEKAMFV